MKDSIIISPKALTQSQDFFRELNAEEVEAELVSLLAEALINKENQYDQEDSLNIIDEYKTIHVLNKEMILSFIEIENQYSIEEVSVEHPRASDWEKYTVSCPDVKKRFYISSHACDRYIERYRLGISKEEAHRTLVSLISSGEGQFSGMPPDGVKSCSGADMFLNFFNNELVLPIVENKVYDDFVVKTVISRAIGKRKSNKQSKKKTDVKKFGTISKSGNKISASSRKRNIKKRNSSRHRRA